MPDFELEQVDGGKGATIDLPHGDTVIGRGPFLGVDDKRVSRNHGILENVDRQLRLKPTHVNPCFIETSAEASPQPLERNQWHQLRDASVFSLLPGKYLYRVRALAQGRTPRNSQGFDEEDEPETERDSKSSRSCEETLAYTPLAKNAPSFTYEAHRADPAACHQVGGDSRSSCKPDAPDPLTPRKTFRVLPAWMMAATPAALNTSSAKAPSRAARNAAPSPKPSAKRPRTKLRSSSADEEEEKGVAENEEEEEEEEEKEKGRSKAPRKRARRLKSETEESQEQAPASGAGSGSGSSTERTWDEDAGAAKKTDKQEKEKESRKAGGSQASNTGGSSSIPENSGTSRQDAQKARHRTPCPYGTSCYRKNPLHFQECSHPGDDDYEEEQKSADEEEDDRPECPYGTDCYRKNPLHKKEYKHTQPPARKATDDEDEDEDQYENSFINDGSEEEDVDEGSDYVPESEDSEKEDMKRLQKEAKAFIQRRRK